MATRKKPASAKARGSLDAKAVAREAARLRELWEQRGATFRAVRLEADARPLVRAFWETLGWSSAFDELALVPPELDVGRARAAARLAEWRDGEMADLELADLPARFRVIEDDGVGVGFSIADETKRGDEPPMRAVLCDTNRIVPMKGSYLRHVSAILLTKLLHQRWPGRAFDARPAPRGVPLLPTLAPGLERLEPGLVLHRDPTRTLPTLHYASATELLDWLERLPAEALSFSFPGALPMPGRYPELAARMTRTTRVFAPLREKIEIRLGELAGMRVALEGDARSGAVFTDGDADRLGALLDDLPLHRIWKHGDGSALPAPLRSHAPRSDEATFARALGELRSLLEELDAAPAKARPPADLPPRARRVVGTLGAHLGAGRLRSLAQSERAIRSELAAWVEAGAPWLEGRTSVRAARAMLPRRARLVATGGEIRYPPVIVVTDEDGETDDPVVLVAWAERPGVVVGAPSLAAMIATLAVRGALSGLGRVVGGGDLPPPWRELEPIGQPWTRLERLAPGVVRVDGATRFASERALADFMASIPTTHRGTYQPPQSCERIALPSGRRAIARFEPDALAADAGFSAYPLLYLGAPTHRRAALGRVGGAPVWVVHDQARGARSEPVVHFAPADRKIVERWIEARMRG